MPLFTSLGILPKKNKKSGQILSTSFVNSEYCTRTLQKKFTVGQIPKTIINGRKSGTVVSYSYPERVNAPVSNEQSIFYFIFGIVERRVTKKCMKIFTDFF